MGGSWRQREGENLPNSLTVTWESPCYLIAVFIRAAAFQMSHFFTTDTVIFNHVKMERVAGVDQVIVTLAS